jgi:predicted Fe-Mo cluster-binding NifX family protein
MTTLRADTQVGPYEISHGGHDTMKIAISTTDGKTICGHLGKCKSFIIYHVDGNEVLKKEAIQVGGACPSSGGDGHGHAHGGHAHNVSPFDGCYAVITQGMGQGMLNALAQKGIRPVITELSDPDMAVRMLMLGDLKQTHKSSCSCGEH